LKVETSSSDQAMGTSFKKSHEMVEALSRANWELLEALLKLKDEREAAAQGIWASIKEAFQADELAVAIGPALADAQSRAVRLLTELPIPKIPPTGPTPPATPVQPGSVRPTLIPQLPRNVYDKKFAHLDSDRAEIAEFYQEDAPAFDRNRQLVEQLKVLYGGSQVDGDALPKGLPADEVRGVLEVHQIRALPNGGVDSRSNMIVVSPTLHTLIHLDANCTIDLTAGQITLFGLKITLRVDSNHKG
jgi:hypothetical protein